MRVYHRTICFVNCHFAAHLEAVGRRNADFEHVYRTMVFGRPANFLNAAAGTALCLLFSCGLRLLNIYSCSMFIALLALGCFFAAGSSSSVQMIRNSNVSMLIGLILYHQIILFSDFVFG